MARKISAPVFFGNGAPTASTGPKGSIYIRLDGGANTTLYVREAAGAVAKATAVLTLTGNATENQTVTVGEKVYRFKATPAQINDVDIGGTASVSIDNLIAAINGGAGAGTLYFTGTTAHPLVTAAAGAGDTMDLTAKAEGAAGNGIVLSETLTNGSWNKETTNGGTFDTGSGWVAK